MLFQAPALFPGKTIEQNALAARRAAKTSRDELNRTIAAVAGMVEKFGLDGDTKTLATDLSGGEYQRAAIIRTLANCSDSKVLLLDEPFKAALNYRIRWQLMEYLKRWQEQSRVTTLLVTHDFSEAAYLASKIVLIYDKKILFSTATELFQRAPNVTVAAIAGHINKWKLSEHQYRLMPLRVEEDKIRQAGAEWCVCRPSSVEVDPGGTTFSVLSKTFLGAHTRCELASVSRQDFRVVADVSSDLAANMKDRCGVTLRPDTVTFYDRDERRIDRLGS